MTPDNAPGEPSSTPETPEQGIQIPPTPAYNPNSDIQSFADAPTETTQPASTSTESVTVAEPVAKKSKKPLIIGIIVAIIIIALVVLGVIFLPKLFSKTDTKTYDETALFIEEANGSNTFAIYNVDGTAVSSFIYSNTSHFYGGHASACLREDNKKCGIVSAAGTISLEFGEYDSLESVSGLYLATKADRRYLINYAGKHLESLDSDDNSTTMKLFTTNERLPFIVYNYDSGKYKLYNDNGDLLKDINSNSKPALYYSPELGKGFLFTEKMVFLLDKDQKNISKEFETDKTYSTVSVVSHDRTVGLLNDDKHYAYFTGEEVIELKSEDCDEVRLAQDGIDRYFNYAVCYEDGIYNAFGYDGSVIKNIGPHPDYYMPDTYIDYEYGTDKTPLEFYRDGKVVKEAELGKGYHTNGATAKGHYYVSSYDRLSECLFDLDGNELTCQQFDEAHYGNTISDVDANNNVVVQQRSDDPSICEGSEDSLCTISPTYHYLKTLDGETKFGPKLSIISYGSIYLVSDKSNIYTNDGYGYWYNAYGTIYLTDENGERILDVNMRYDEITAIDENTIYAHDHFRLVSEIISVKDRKVLLTIKDGHVIERYRNYLIVKNGDRSTYYQLGTYQKIFAQ